MGEIVFLIIFDQDELEVLLIELDFFFFFVY